MAQNFGQFADNGSCSYDCGFQEQTWWWHWDGTAWVKSNTLGPAITGLSVSGPWATAAAPTLQWVQADLPNYNTAITAGLANGGDSSINDALSQVAASLTEANNALQSIARWVTWEQPQGAGLSALCTSLASQAQTTLQNLAMDLIGKVSCGQGDIENSITNNAKTPVAASFANMTAPLAAAQAAFGAAMNGASGVAGAFLNIQSFSAVATAQLTQALGCPAGSALRRLHLIEAGNDWQALMTYALAQFIP